MCAHLIETLSHPSESNVREILQPLEVRNGHASRIQIQIRDDHHVLFGQNLIGFESGGTVGSFGNQFCLNARRIFPGDLVLQRCGNQDIAGKFKRILGYFYVCCSRIIQD